MTREVVQIIEVDNKLISLNFTLLVGERRQFHLELKEIVMSIFFL